MKTQYKEEKVIDALEWLAAMCSHVPNKGEQMVRYYGYYRVDAGSPIIHYTWR